MHKVDLGIFAHDEADQIGAFLKSLAPQIPLSTAYDLRILLLLNGCKDDTAAIARRTLQELDLVNQIEIHDLADAGKSKTWNHYTHVLSRDDADFLLFCDADIRFERPHLLQSLIDFLADNPQLVASSSIPIKDLSLETRQLGLVEQLIVSGGSDPNEIRTAICGMLYIARTSSLRRIFMPIGLPVEDGFLRAMLLTSCFAAPENPALIDAVDDNWHIYESERTVRDLVRHQIRLTVGGAVNATIFRHLESVPEELRPATLEAASKDAEWLSELLRKELPRWPDGWVPFHFLFKRTAGTIATKRWWRPKQLFKLVLGASFDLVTWLAAQWTIARGRGSGFW